MGPATLSLWESLPACKTAAAIAVNSDPTNRRHAQSDTTTTQSPTGFTHPSAPIMHALFRVARKGRSTVGAMLQPLGL